MSLTNEELTILRKKTDTTEKQVKPSPLKDKPRRVSMTSDECKALCESTGLDYRTGYENRVIERVTTTEAPDRDGDIVRFDGVDNTQYRTEPVVLFAHDRGSLPVGRSLKEWKDKSITGWKSWDLYFDDQIDPTGKSDVVFRMVSNGAMRGGSIGFIPTESKYDHSDDERKKLGLGKYGVEFKRVLKLEHSACSVPANQEALAGNIKSLDRKILQGTLTVKDLDILERHCMLDNNMIDILYDVLNVKRIVSIPKNEGDFTTIDYVQKPYPNEHAARVREPDDFEQDSFRRKKVTDGISIIIGKLTGETSMTTQAYRFDKDKFTVDEAKKWLKDNNVKYTSFEPASEKEVKGEIMDDDMNKIDKKDIDKTANIVLNLDMKGVIDELDSLSNKLKTIEGKADEILKVFGEKVESLIATANRAISAIERTKTESRLYDREGLERILKL